MKDITKNRQSEEQLIRMTQKIFGLNMQLSAFRELSEGFCNVAYWIQLSDGRECILKISPDKDVKMMSCEVKLMKTEVGAMELAAQNLFPGVAKIYGYDDTLTICSGEYFFMEKLEGQSYFSAKEAMPLEEQQKIEFETGRCLSLLKQIKGKKFGHFCEEELQFESWFDAFYTMLSRVIKDGIAVNIDIGVSYDAILNKLQEHKKCFEEVTEPYLVHFDSWDGNIFVKNGEIVGMIDWERALWAECFMEDRFRFHNQCRHFMDGYGISELTENQHIRCRWYDVYLYLIMMFEGEYRHYDNHDQYNWVHGMFEQLWPQLWATRLN